VHVVLSAWIHFEQLRAFHSFIYLLCWHHVGAPYNITIYSKHAWPGKMNILVINIYRGCFLKYLSSLCTNKIVGVESRNKCSLGNVELSKNLFENSIFKPAIGSCIKVVK
jgi:hypothetical protein